MPGAESPSLESPDSPETDKQQVVAGVSTVSEASSDAPVPPETEALADGLEPAPPSGSEVLKGGWQLQRKTDTGFWVVVRNRSDGNGTETKILGRTEYDQLREPPQEPPAQSPERPEEPTAATPGSEAGAGGNDEENQMEQNVEDYEKLADKNIDPRVIIALKQKVEEKFQAQGQPDASTKKVMGIREVTRHLLAQGAEVGEDGDFTPEGMQLLQAMSTMMDIPDWALERLKSERVGHEPPFMPEPNDQALIDFIKQRNEENLLNLPSRSKETTDDKEEKAVTTGERVSFIGRLIAHRAYAKIRWVKKDIDKGINNGHNYLDSTLDRVLESLNSDDIDKRRRSVLGWLAGTLATTSSTYVGVDRELLSSPSLAPGSDETSDFFQPSPTHEAEKPLPPEVKIDESTRNMLGRAGILSSDEFLNQENGKKYHIVESDPHYEQNPGLILLEDSDGHVLSADYNSLMAQLRSGKFSIGRVRQVGPIS